MEILESTLENSQTAILATDDGEGKPSMRWMTPTIVRDRPGVLFALTSKKFAKSEHLEKNPHVQWMVQTKSLTMVMNVEGRVNMIENPMLKAEIIEAIGPRLRVFWKVNQNPEDLVVLETVISRGSIFTPVDGEKEEVDFEGGEA